MHQFTFQYLFLHDMFECWYMYKYYVYYKHMYIVQIMITCSLNSITNYCQIVVFIWTECTRLQLTHCIITLHVHNNISINTSTYLSNTHVHAYITNSQFSILNSSFRHTWIHVWMNTCIFTTNTGYLEWITCNMYQST